MARTAHTLGADTIDAALAGDRAALEQVADQALGVALRTAVALVGDRDLAGDVAQDVALITVRRLGGLRDPSSFDAWVYRTAVRESVSASKRRRLRATREASLDADASHAEIAATGAADVDAQLTMASSLRALPNRQRAAVVLRYVHDLSDEDIATVLRCRVGTVHALLSRARSALRDDPAVHQLKTPRVGESR